MVAYVPTPRHVSQASPQSQELAHKLESVIREYRQSHPRLSDSELQLAIQLAASRTGAGIQRARRILVLLLAAGVAALLGALLFLQAAG